MQKGGGILISLQRVTQALILACCSLKLDGRVTGGTVLAPERWAWKDELPDVAGWNRASGVLLLTLLRLLEGCGCVLFTTKLLVRACQQEVRLIQMRIELYGALELG